MLFVWCDVVGRRWRAGRRIAGLAYVMLRCCVVRRKIPECGHGVQGDLSCPTKSHAIAGFDIQESMLGYNYLQPR